MIKYLLLLAISIIVSMGFASLSVTFFGFDAFVAFLIGIFLAIMAVIVTGAIELFEE